MAKKDPLRTKLCDMLQIEYPIVAFTHCKDVAAEVINAGAFAVLGQTQSTPEEIEANVKWMRSKVGDKAFGIDLVFPASVPAQASIQELLAQIPKEQQDFANDIARRYNIKEPKKTPELYDLGWMKKDTARKQLEVALELRVPVLASGLGNPDFFIPAAHERGMQVWGLVGKQRQAKKELEAGVDVIVAQGLDPKHLPESDPSKMDFGAAVTGAKAWKEIWGCGQGIGAVKEIVPAGELVDRLAREYDAARARLGLSARAMAA